MIEKLHSFLSSVWVRVIAVLGLLVALVFYVWKVVESSTSRAGVESKRAAIQIKLFNDKRAAQDKEESAIDAIDLQHSAAMTELDARALEITASREDSRAVLAAAINRAFR